MQFNDLHKQQARIKPQLDEAIARVLAHGKYIMGPEVQELEQQLAAFTGAKHVIACANGTDALTLALRCFDLGPGDAVFTTDFSFFATAEVIPATGATPVLVDIDKQTYNLSPDCLREAIASVRKNIKLKPKGVIVADIFGQPAEYSEIQQICTEEGLFCIQDGAQSFGATAYGKTAPNHADIGTASFFPAKPLGCYGDSGAVFTDNDEFAELLSSLRVHGKGNDKYDNIHLGYNSRLDTLQAAILLEKLKIYSDEIERRQHVAATYREQLLLLAESGKLILPKVPENVTSVYAQFSILVDNRDDVQQALRKAEIPSAVYYPTPMHSLKAMKDIAFVPFECPNAEYVSKHILALPFHPYMKDDDIALVADTICEICGLSTNQSTFSDSHNSVG